MTVKGTETWNGADSGTFGVTQTWTETSDASETIDQQGSPTTIASAAREVSARCETVDAGSTDHEILAVIPTLTRTSLPLIGVAGRFAAGAITYYRFAVFKTVANPNGEWDLNETVAGVESSISGGTYTYTAGDEIKLRLEGSTLTCTIAGVQVGQFTDATITTGTLAGYTGYRDVSGDLCRIDGWQLSDLVVVAAGTAEGNKPIRQFAPGKVQPGARFIQNFIGDSDTSAHVGEAVSLSGHGDASSAGTADIRETADLRGHGDASSAGTGDLRVLSNLAGHGDAASAGTGVTRTLANLSGHGDAASAGNGDARMLANQRGHGDAASAGTGDLQIVAQLAGHGDASSAGAGYLIGSVSTGHGDAASAGSAELRVLSSLAGHGDASSAGTGTPRVLLSLAGHGDAASAGRGILVGSIVAAVAHKLSLGRRRAVAPRSHGIRGPT